MPLDRVVGPGIIGKQHCLIVHRTLAKPISGSRRVRKPRMVDYLTARVSQCGDERYFASSAERPGSGSPRIIMFGVNSAAHAASRSAKTSAGAARNSAIVCEPPSLPRSTAEIRACLTPILFAPTISKHPDELRLDCVKIQAAEEPKLDGFLAPSVVVARLAS